MLDDILARQLYGGNGWRIANERRTSDGIEVQLVPTRESAICAGCGETKRRTLDTKHRARRWRHLDGWGIPTLVIAPVRRVRCRWCGVRIERAPWARPGSRFTHAFELEMLKRARDTSIAGVCRQLGVHWTTVNRLITRWVKEAADRRFRRRLRMIGVDEISYGRGQSKYLTVVWDHERGQVVWIGEGREEQTLGQFFEKLGRRRARRLWCVTMDMAHGYIAAVTTYAPQAEIVFDRFHIERHMTEAVNDVRKQEFFRRGGRYRDVIRGKKYLLLKKRRRLHWRKRPQLDALLALNRRLSRAYVLKEQFEHAWTYRTEGGMWDFLLSWRAMLRWTRLRPLLKFWKMIERHQTGVTNWARWHLTNAALEGNNRSIRGLSHRAHGYRNPTNLMHAIYISSWRP
jgi:transposase